MEATPNQQSHPDGENDNKMYRQEPVRFDWTNRWLKGHQYAFILKNIDAYCAKYGFQRYEYKMHPESIYQNPANGMLYFVKGTGVGPDFGFPRVARKKRYRWKKMNFTTNLPKQMTHVTYIVASAMKSQRVQDQMQITNFRMHAVIPFKDRIDQYSEPSEYILCHVRNVKKKITEQQESPLRGCFRERFVDFYKLFAIIHNFQLDYHKTDNFSL